MSEQVRPIRDVAAARKALQFFKVMAILVGIGLLVLCLGMVLKYGFDRWACPISGTRNMASST